MTPTNQDWIMGAPKEPIACEWVVPSCGKQHGFTISKDYCKAYMRNGVPCYRHRPIKEKE